MLSLSLPSAATVEIFSPVLPHVAVAAYLVCVAATGVLINAAVLTALFRRERNVFNSIIMQLALADLLLLSGAAGFETWARNEGTWRFGCDLCVLYLGCEVFATTASVYFVVTLALHAIATANLEEANADLRLRRARLKDDDSDGELRSSRHSLVANSDSSTPPRTMNIDYRIANSSVPVAVPLAFVWILSVSISVPEFALATTVDLAGLTLCTVADPSQRFNMHALLAMFDIFIPAFILTTAASVALCKLRARCRKRLGSGSEVDAALKLSVWLVGIYLSLNAPRLVLASLHAYVMPQDDFRNPLLNTSMVPRGFGLACTCTSYAAALLRPVLSIILLPDLRRSFSRAPDRARVV